MLTLMHADDLSQLTRTLWHAIKMSNVLEQWHTPINIGKWVPPLEAEYMQPQQTSSFHRHRPSWTV
jgi:hypothetical protein